MGPYLRRLTRLFMQQQAVGLVYGGIAKNKGNTAQQPFASDRWLYMTALPACQHRKSPHIFMACRTRLNKL